MFGILVVLEHVSPQLHFENPAVCVVGEKSLIILSPLHHFFTKWGKNGESLVKGNF